MNHLELDNYITENINGFCWTTAKSNTIQRELNKGRGENSMEKTLGINPDNIRKHTKIVFGLSGGSTTYAQLVNNRRVREMFDRFMSNGMESTEIYTDADFIRDGGVIPTAPTAPDVFVAEPHKWGHMVHEGKNAIMTHNEKGGRYLVAFCVANVKSIMSYSYDGQPIDLTESKFDSYRKPPRIEGARQELENPIIVRMYDFHNIEELKLLGKNYIITA